MIKLDKTKYLEIMKSEGVNAALTALHQDSVEFEHSTFEGIEGFQPADWDKLFEVRSFSRELWEEALKSESSSS